jgi:hypothetical protein
MEGGEVSAKRDGRGHMRGGDAGKRGGATSGGKGATDNTRLDLRPEGVR